MHDEAAAVVARYGKRHGDAKRYSLLTSSVLLANQERQRAIVDMLVERGWHDVGELRLLEVGCGTGMNLLEFVRLGFSPEHVQGIELLPDSVDQARRVLPASVRVIQGDAVHVDETLVPDASHDIVYQSVVFSSLLDEEFQQRLADRMWRWLRPGGGILWYDFVVDNPRNRDVRGIPVKRVRQLFSERTLKIRRITLAPPIARAVTLLHPRLYGVFNTCPWFRSHVLAWIEKRA